MSFIRTVLGDVTPAEMGVCYSHEHLIIDPSFATAQTPDFLLDDVERCVEELSACHAAGVRTMVDSMPTAAGRNVEKLAAVSRRTGLHILCPTGLHLRKYYPPTHWVDTITADALADLFVREITRGIDLNDGDGAYLPAPHRAGLIKIASGLGRIDDHERKLFEAAAAAHRKTGAPILTHTEQGTAAIEQAALLKSLGVDLSHVVLSHLDRNPDVAYQRELLSSGVVIEYDSAFRWKTADDNPTLVLLLALIDEFPDQIVLGMDAARRSYWKSYGGQPGMTFLSTTWAERMTSAGIDRDRLRRIFVTTPAASYTFGEGRS